MKSSKPLWRISVTTSPEVEDAVGELLASIFGLAAAAYFDLESQTSHVSVFLEAGKFSRKPHAGKLLPVWRASKVSDWTRVRQKLKSPG
jgi:hypothetical protein